MRKLKTKIKRILRKPANFIKHPFDRKKEPLLHTIEWMFILAAFVLIGISVLYFQVATNYLGGWWEQISSEQAGSQIPEAEKKFIGETITEPVVDITGWDTYKNQWYGFEIKHPDSWKNNTQYKTATEKSARYEIMYKFRKEGEGSGGIFDGYDVKIYQVRKVQGVENTNDIHKKDIIPEGTGECKVPEEEVVESDDLTLQKVSIGQDDPCYKPAYFYSVTKGSYIYNIVPAVGESGARYAEPEKKTDKLFPEYKEAVKSFNLITVERPKAAPAPVKPRITAPRPVSAKLVNGQLVCAKKNDKPGKSKKNKPRHMDMECCLDPDETPNPWCTYSSSKYAKYL